MEIGGKTGKKALESNRMDRTRLETNRLGMIDGDRKVTGRRAKAKAKADGRGEMTEHVQLLSVEGHLQLCCKDLFGHEEGISTVIPNTYMGVIRRGREHANKCESRTQAISETV